MKLLRLLKHLFSPPWLVRRYFPKHSLTAIESAIANSERLHRGELRFVVENALDLTDLSRGISARQRAIDLFSECRIWDTEQNSGVLIYLLLADRQVEIVADRGINAKVDPTVWENICHDMETHFRADEFERGVVAGIEAITQLLRLHFAVDDSDTPNELANAPIVLT